MSCYFLPQRIIYFQKRCTKYHTNLLILDITILLKLTQVFPRFLKVLGIDIFPDLFFWQGPKHTSAIENHSLSTKTKLYEKWTFLFLVFRKNLCKYQINDSLPDKNLFFWRNMELVTLGMAKSHRNYVANFYVIMNFV